MDENFINTYNENAQYDYNRTIDGKEMKGKISLYPRWNYIKDRNN
jgi:hypothetical protein